MRIETRCAGDRFFWRERNPMGDDGGTPSGTDPSQKEIDLADPVPLPPSMPPPPPVKSATAFDRITQQSKWNGDKSQKNRTVYVRLKGMQIVLAAAIPVVSVAAASDPQRWTSAGMGALIGIVEGFLQLGQYQQNWLLYRATREALKREEFLYGAVAGPYAGAASRDDLYIERCDAIMSGENAKWLATQQKAASEKKS
jgi:hypothetical protein